MLRYLVFSLFEVTKCLFFLFFTLEQDTKESMINRLSNLINRNRLAAKISQVLCSSVYMYLCIILPRLISLQNIIPCLFSVNNNKPYLDACVSSHFFVKELGSKFEKRNRMKSSMPVCIFGECEFYVFF